MYVMDLIRNQTWQNSVEINQTIGFDWVQPLNKLEPNICLVGPNAVEFITRNRQDFLLLSNLVPRAFSLA